MQMAWAGLGKWALALSGAVWVMLGGSGAILSPGPDYSRTPVLFIHGYGMSPNTWNRMIDRAVGVGYPPEYLHAVEIVPRPMTNIQAARTVIEPSAKSLLARAQAAARRAGYQGGGPQYLDIVSHSMGAVSSRWYAARLQPERVRTWVALTGANHGTKSLCPYNDDAAREMCPAFATSPAQSAVQVALNGTPDAPLDETPFGLGLDRSGPTRIPPAHTRSILYFTIRIEPDSWIKPERSAILDGAGGLPILVPSGVPIEETSPGNYLFHGGADHDSLPQHPDVIRFVLALLGIRDRYSP